MDWRIDQAEFRRRTLAKFDEAECARYDALVGQLSREDEDAYCADLSGAVAWRPGMTALDVGAGTGAMCGVLARVAPEAAITALEPAPAMLARLLVNYPDVACRAGWCDHAEDRSQFTDGQFDVIVSRQLVNGLYDPLAAFRNWRAWLKPRGVVVVIDGIYGREAWAGAWAEDVDVLPASAVQSAALIPYLLEYAGFTVAQVRWMDAVNARPATRTKRSLVTATTRT